MTRESMAVRFKDGQIKYGLFNGTVCIVWPKLFDSQEQAWEHLDAGTYVDFYPRGLEQGLPADDMADNVLVWVPGQMWRGRATKDWLLSPAHPFENPEVQILNIPFSDSPPWKGANEMGLV